MTEQVADIVYWNGERRFMDSLPLEAYFKRVKKWPNFAFVHTANYRGYVAKWEIVDGKLYLIGLDSQLEDGSAFGLKDLFPDAAGRVFADWFSGVAHLPFGQRVHGIHLRYDQLRFEDGVLVGQKQNEFDGLMSP